MRRLITTAAMLAALILPAHAAENVKEQAVSTLGAAMVYDTYCEPVSKSTFAIIDMLAGDVSRLAKAEAFSSIMRAYTNAGHDKFCSVLKPGMDQMNQSTSPLDAYVK